MSLFYFSITLAICSSALYHFVAKSTPANVNFTVSLLVTYAVAFTVTLFTFFFFPAKNGVVAELNNSTGPALDSLLRWSGLNSAFCSSIAQAGIWELPRY